MQGTLAYLNQREAARLAEITASCAHSIDVTRDELTYLRVAVSSTDAELHALRVPLLVNADGMVRAEGEVIWRASFADWRAHTP